MARAIDAQWHNIAFAAVALREILDNPLEGETPQSRLKQIGMMSVLYYMHQAHQALTLTNIVEMTELTRGGVIETIDMLVRRNLLNETMVKNSMGRGKARQFEIAPPLFARVRSLQIS